MRPIRVALLALLPTFVWGACSSQTNNKAGEDDPAGSTEPAGEPGGDVEASAGEPAAEQGPSREELARKALERVPEIQNGVAELRGLPFETEVPAEYQNEADFRAFVEREIERELPAAKAASLSRALHHIGLLESELDLPKVLSDAMVSQAGAYYDPKQKKFFLVMVPQSDLILDTISSHELTHALQDQHFDLNRYYYGHDGDGPPKFSEDELNARRFIVEGEATFVMVAYGAMAMAKVNMLADDKTVAALRPQLEMFGNMDVEQLRKMTEQQAEQFVDMGDDFKKSIEAMDEIPMYILVPLLESYMKGVLPVYEAYLAGGWKAVGELYENPPSSTEQVLHPATKLVGKRDYPVAITLPAPGKGWSEVHSEVLGELGWRVYFMLWKAADPNAPAAGWDGDRYAVYETDGKLVGLIATTWDTADDAKEFADAYLASLAKRFPDGETSEGKGWNAVARGEDSRVYVRVAGKDVYIADGASDPSQLDRLASKTKKKRDKRDR